MVNEVVSGFHDPVCVVRGDSTRQKSSSGKRRVSVYGVRVGSEGKVLI